MKGENITGVLWLAGRGSGEGLLLDSASVVDFIMSELVMTLG
jgi:hypothetical protein